MSEDYADIDQAVEKGGLHAGVALALHRENKQLRDEVARLKRDAERYRRLQVLGCAPSTSKQLENGTVLRFTNLDEFVDADIKAVPSRGEAALTPQAGKGGGGS